MAKIFTPIIDLKYDRKWDNEILTDELEEYEHPDEFTYTMRITVPQAEQEVLRIKLLKREGGEALVKLLQDNGWSVSFLVDC